MTHPQPIHGYFKHCPHCGSSDILVTPAQRKFACKACGFSYFYENVAVATAGIITNENGEILLTKRAKDPQKDWWDLPGGFLEIGETAEQGFQRELQEELGLEVNNVQYLCSFPNEYVYEGVIYHVLDISFTAQVSGIHGKTDPNEISAYQYFQPQDVPVAQIAFPSLRQSMLYYLSKCST